MPGGRAERRLIAILAADVAGYAHLVGADEAATLKMFKAHLAEALAPAVSGHGGRIIKTVGDGVLAEFASSVEALLCAVEFQRAMAQRNDAAGPAMMFRIGVNAGDVVSEDGDVFGDAVNVTARLEALAPPGGICVSERVREDALGRNTNLVFEDTGAHQLKNIERPVRVFRVQMDAAPFVAGPALALPDKPSIAVLPFQSMSDDAAQDYFADGVTEDIITALSHWHWFFVIARNSSFIYKGRAVDVRQVARELGVRYVLEGSVRRIGARTRIAGQLIDASNGAHIWAENYDRDISDIFALQDEITQSVVAAVEPAMMRSEGQRMSRKGIRDLTAFECAQRGLWHLNRLDEDDYAAACGCFRECIARDGEMALGHVGLSRTLYGGLVYGFSRDPHGDLARAYEAANQGVKLDPDDAHGFYALAGSLLLLGRHAEALDAAERAIRLNPNFANGYFRLGQILIYSGRANEAAAHIERAMRHNPYDPRLGTMLFVLAIAEHHCGNFDRSIEHAQSALRHDEWRAASVLGASLARLGRFDEARVAFPPETLARLASEMRLLTYANPADLAYAVEGLRMAANGAPN